MQPHMPPALRKIIFSYLHQPYDHAKSAVLRQLEERCRYVSDCPLKSAVLRQLEERCRYVSDCPLKSVPYVMLDGPCRYKVVACRFRHIYHQWSACSCRRCRRDLHGLLG